MLPGNWDLVSDSKGYESSKKIDLERHSHNIMCPWLFKKKQQQQKCSESSQIYKNKFAYKNQWYLYQRGKI